MKRVFVLEDNPVRIEIIKENWFQFAEFDIATSFKEAVELFSDNYDLLMLDHDLGGKIFVSSKDEDTGANFLRWFVANKFKDCDIIIHSHNPVGSKNMEEILTRNGYYKAIRIPFGNLIDGWDKGILGFFNHYKG
jgi:CheY-like chemotaxis protein